MLDKNQHFLTEPDAITLIEKYNIPYAAHIMAASPGEAAKAASSIGFPVVLKIVSPDVPHKSDAGGVVVNLSDEDAVRQAYSQMIDRVQSAAPNAKLEGALVCRQAEPGLEVIVGALIDQTFGPTVMFGLGGIYTEILQDVSFRIAPFGKWDASKMIHEIRGYPLLAGARGSKAIDFDALENLLAAVSNLISEQPQVCELDLNPVRLYPQGLLALDARVLVSASK